MSLSYLFGIRDYGCPTSVEAESETGTLFVTSEGELLRDGTLIPGQCVDWRELARRQGFDWEKVCLLKREGEDPLVPVWFSAVAEEENYRLRQILTGREHDFVQKCYSAQQAVGSINRFRVYGRLRAQPRNVWGEEARLEEETIVLVTEFREFARLADAEKWRAVEAMVLRTQAHLWVMDEGLECERSWTSDPRRPEMPVEERFGEHHGWPYAQVELSWRIERLYAHEIKALLATLRRETDKLWQACGVGVC